ncbi:MAG TPA: patatin-like phospholipase family protein, partial [Bacteroidales bacterium]
MRNKSLLLFIFIVFPALLYSQSVAVVLSGGGAKAFTHIGVLRALEENNIPIDYIVGNSMGAMVGALYSAGFSPDEIQFLLSDADLYAFKRGNTKIDRFTFQQFEDDASWINIPLTFKKGDRISLPFNMYNIQELDYLIMEFFAGPSAAAYYNFDSLMIPFRCVATDIDSSRLVILKHGELAKAVRASLTFPFFIRPIRID